MNKEHTPNIFFSPTVQTERIILLDSLRGIAVLGILLMNIPFFGLPDPAGDNPVPMNELNTINEKIYIFINVVLNGTQRAIFSILFGAGILLFISRLEKRTGGIQPADIFIRRQLWLIVFGLFNAYILLWPGDILFVYGICGVIVFVFRHLKVKALLIAAGICLVLMTARENVNLYRKKAVISKGEAAAMVDSSKRTTEEKIAFKKMEDIKEQSKPEALKEEMQTVLKKMQGSYSEAYDYFKDLNVKIEVKLGYYSLWDILIFLFLGMAFFKSGILQGEAPTKYYWILAIVGIIPGIMLSWWWMKPLIQFKYNLFDSIKHTSVNVYELARTLRSVGFFGLIMLIYKSGIFKWLFSLMRPVGQMAFTNYLTQSFMCNFFFLGAGLGMIGKMDRKEVYLFAIAIWVIQIIWCHLWLRYFQFGPLEWCWRSLTYWKRQPFKKNTVKN